MYEGGGTRTHDLGIKRSSTDRNSKPRKAASSVASRLRFRGAGLEWSTVVCCSVTVWVQSPPPRENVHSPPFDGSTGVLEHSHAGMVRALSMHQI